MGNKAVYFKFIKPKVDKNFPITPEAEIHSRHAGGFVRLSPKITEVELDGFIDHLIDELEAIRKEGHKAFLKAKKELKS